MIRATAYVLRYKHNLLHPSQRSLGPLSIDEINAAEIELIKVIQREAFSNELKILHDGDELPANSPYRALSLFLHTDGLIRVGGRLQHAQISFDYKHQILLPKKHKFTSALIRSTHHLLCHAGVQATLTSLIQRFWIPSSRRTIKSVLKNCQKCFRFTHFRSTQIMGALPSVRVNIEAPFTKCGLDYMGPIPIRLAGPKSKTVVKSYIALFICMVTRAVHLEVVTELSTKAFLAALTRFISIRGTPCTIYSDNATTFHGANNELQDLFNFLQSSQNQRSLQNSVSIWKIQWCFIPPRAPHFGGLWERSIQSFKNIFKRNTLKQILNLEETCTLAAQIGAIINSTPLVGLSEDPHDLAYLSPGHFLIGRPLTALPSKPRNEKHINFLNRWNRLSEFNKELWQRWSDEYLNTLQKRHKWTSSSPNIKVGTLVLLKDPGTLPTGWKLGRIIEVFPAADNKVRVVSVLTDSGVFKRSITSIAPLPLEEADVA